MLYLAALFACGQPEPAPDLGASEVALAFTDDDGKLVCPVMGDVIAGPEQAVGHVEHGGTTYYFCCDSCQHMFTDDPERYAGGKFLAHLKEAHGGHFGNCHHVL